MNILKINYTEFKPDTTYQGVEVHMHKFNRPKEVVVFDTCDPVADFDAAVNWLRENELEFHYGFSCDDFVRQSYRYAYWYDRERKVNTLTEWKRTHTYAA